MMRMVFLALGIIFGFLLSRAGATTFDFHAKLFLFDNLQLLWVIGTAVITGIIGIQIFKRLHLKSVITEQALDFRGKAMRKHLVSGALLLGLGWGMTGSCPGTAPAMLGEGKLIVLFTLSGIIVGTYLYGLIRSRASKPEENPVTEGSVQSGEGV